MKQSGWFPRVTYFIFIDVILPPILMFPRRGIIFLETLILLLLIINKIKKILRVLPTNLESTYRDFVRLELL